MQSSERARSLISQYENESDFRKRLLIPLLRRMGYSDVVDAHGPGEQGKDIVGQRSDGIFGPQHHAFVVKYDKITGSVANKTGSAYEVWIQVQAALRIPWNCLLSKRIVSISRAIVISGGHISNAARDSLVQMAAAEPALATRVEFVDVDELTTWIERYWPDAYTEASPHLDARVRAAYDKLLTDSELAIAFGQLRKRKLESVLVTVSLQQVVTDVRRSRSGEAAFRKSSRVVTSRRIVTDTNAKVLITGTAGSGKTTLLQGMLKHAYDETISGRTSVVPIFARARDLRMAPSSDCLPTILDAAAKWIGIDGTDLLEYVEHLKSRPLMLFVDGVDEIADSQIQSQLVSWLAALRPSQSIHKIIVSARESAFPDTAVLRGFTPYTVLPLTVEIAREFVGKWFHSDTSACDMLNRALGEGHIASVIPLTPLVLTLLASIVEDAHVKAEIPTNLTELYSVCVDMALQRWDAAKGIRTAFEYQTKHQSLVHLANCLHESGNLSIDRATAANRLKEYWAEAGVPLVADMVIDEIVQRSGLLKSSRYGDLEFSHPSFQSFFVGHHLRDLPNYDHTVATRFVTPWWSLPIFFSLGMKKKADSAFRALDQMAWANGGNSESVMAAARNIGFGLQAAFLTNARIKKQWLLWSLRHLSSLLERTMRGEWTPEGIAVGLPKLFYFILYYRWFREAFGSVVLRESVLDVATDPRLELSDVEVFILFGAVSQVDPTLKSSFTQRLLDMTDQRIRFLASHFIEEDGGHGAHVSSVVGKLRRQLSKHSSWLKDLVAPPKDQSSGGAKSN